MNWRMFLFFWERSCGKLGASGMVADDGEEEEDWSGGDTDENGRGGGFI